MSKRIVGPFLGPRGISGISICIGLPDHTIEELTCKLTSPNHFEKELNTKPKYSHFQLFQFAFEDLNPQETYRYEFSYTNKNGQTQRLDLGSGVTYEDCQFKVLGNHKESSFILLSCNNPFETEKGSADNGWAMWEQLESFLQKDNSIRLIVLGGDQVYNDDIEKEFLSKNDKKKKNSVNTTGQDLSDDKVKNQLKDRFISQYQKYWGNKSYRKIFASIPSVAMWDDHDITDGWGSRPESFPEILTKQKIKNHSRKKPYYFKDDWWEYFKIAREVFTAYQASRNSNKIDNIPKETFSSYLDWGESRLILCDFRSERNSKKNILWSKSHKQAVFDFIKNTPENIKKIFFLTPVVPLRTNFQGDKRLSKISKNLFRFKNHINKNNPWYILKSWKWCLFLLLFLFPLAGQLLECNMCNSLPTGIYALMYVILIVLFPTIGALFLLWFGFSKTISIINKIPHLPELSDDIEDGLSSKTNMESLKEILDVLLKIKKENNKEVFILSGDIHLGGLTEIIDTRDNKRESILQIVSSPIAYKPMPKVVEGLTTTTSEMILRECSDEKRLFARNIFYISKRNFAQIIPDKINEGKGIKFFLEGHQLPLIFPKEFF